MDIKASFLLGSFNACTLFVITWLPSIMLSLVLSYAYNQHLTLRPSTVYIGGSSTHFSKREGQRAANRPPVGGGIRLGGWPMINSGSLSPCKRGTLFISF